MSANDRVVLRMHVPLDRAVELYAVRRGVDVHVVLVCDRQRDTEAIGHALLMEAAPP